jgi:putative oxidoreductase
LAALIFHQGVDDSEALEFRKDFALAGGLFALAALGGGACSLDALFARRLMPALARSRADAVPR